MIRKKLLVLLMMVVSVMLLACGCSCNENDKSFSVPTGFVLKNGVLKWDDIEGASAYEYSFDGNTYKEINDASLNLLELVYEPGDYVIKLRGKAGEKIGEIGEYVFKAQKPTAPTKPVIEEDAQTHEFRFKWSSEKGDKYLLSVNDGKWFTISKNTYTLDGNGTYAIQVKVKGFSVDNMLFLESDASLKSDPFENFKGPALMIEDVNVISWSSETEFDSYNIYVDGIMVKENILLDENGEFNLVAGTSPVITKTGEYSIQIEGIKNGRSAWSNILEEVGTTNINKNEIASFDNRIARFTQVKDGVSISNERFHGDTGYSLKINLQSSLQLNMIKYASGSENDIDYRRIKKVSYWVYIESIEGYESVSPLTVPGIRWEKGFENGEYISNVVGPEENIKTGEWVNIIIDNVQCVNPQVIIFTMIDGDEIGNVTMFIDDITYEELWPEDLVQDYDYKLSYSSAALTQGLWYGTDCFEINAGVEHASETVIFNMEVCGNANPESGSRCVGIMSTYNNTSASKNDLLAPAVSDWNFIDSSLISTGVWNKVSFKVTLNSEGKTYFSAQFFAQEVSTYAYDLYIKNIEIELKNDPGGTAMPDGVAKGDGFRQSFVGLSTEYEVGTNVRVTMKIYITGEYIGASCLSVINGVNELGTITAAPDFAVYADMEAHQGEWFEVEFDAIVGNYSELAFSGFPTISGLEYGNAVYISSLFFASVNSFNYKDVVISVKE